MSRRVALAPGRVRVRDHAWRDAATLETLAGRVRAIRGVTSTRGNPLTGSLLVLFDPAQAEAATVLRALGVPSPSPAAGAQAPATKKPAAARRRARHPRPLRMRVNQAAKIGMLGSLGVSLALAASGRKHGHVAAGGVFLACLGTHLTVYRKQLLR